ncbi:MAG: di-heme-cytochrome C peroxidase [Haliangiales bacterium]
MQRVFWQCAIGALGFGLLMAGCSKKPPPQTGTKITEGMKVKDAYGDVIELDQGWTDDTQQGFYNTPQGAEIMPYEWILALEQADSGDKFIAPANIQRFRYLPRKPSTKNPDGLPVGWVKGADSTGKDWFGLTCSACHTGQIQYTTPGTDQSIEIRIDGAPTLADFNLMNEDMVAAMKATLAQEDKFDRFAKAVLKSSDNDDSRNALRGELEIETAKLDTRNKINATEVHYGFARIDAIGFIFNQTMSTLPGIPENALPSDAPASYPFLWGTDQSDVVQWTGFAANLDGAGTLVRNGGEVIGVYGRVELTEKDAYVSSLDIPTLGQLENWVRELNSPVWPEHVFPEIDAAKAKAGEALYKEQCASCHQVIAREDAIKTGYKAVITPITEIGTDPTELENMLNREYEAGIYEGKKSASIAGDKIPNPTTGLNPLVNAVTGSLLEHKWESLKSFASEHATRSGGGGPAVSGYKARPMNGVWATAPYLHNGSVPNLYELLLPVAQRSATFTLGSREYDPVRVGYALDQPTSASDYTPFVFDVSLKGNSNAGHLYGTCMPDQTDPCNRRWGRALTDEERWQIVEYMKTL